MVPEPPAGPRPPAPDNQNRGQTYSKVFRYRLPEGQTREPERVEVVGSFTHWKTVP